MSSYSADTDTSVMARKAVSLGDRVKEMHRMEASTSPKGDDVPKS